MKLEWKKRYKTRISLNSRPSREVGFEFFVFVQYEILNQHKNWELCTISTETSNFRKPKKMSEAEKNIPIHKNWDLHLWTEEVRKN